MESNTADQIAAENSEKTQRKESFIEDFINTSPNMIEPAMLSPKEADGRNGKDLLITFWP